MGFSCWGHFGCNDDECDFSDDRVDRVKMAASGIGVLQGKFPLYLSPSINKKRDQ
jgi:hypothetical protein